MRLTEAIAALLCIAAVVHAADGLPIDTKRLVEDAGRQHVQLLQRARLELADWQRSLRTYKSGRIDSSLPVPYAMPDEAKPLVVFRDKGEQVKFIERATKIVTVLTKEIAEARKGKRKFVPYLRGEFDLGQVGRIEGKLAVFQVAGPNTLLAKAHFDPPSEPFRERRLIWIEGVSTVGVVDESTIELDTIFQYTGSRQYATALGG